MNRFWDNVIKPIIESINANYIIEVGSDTGINTQNILEYCVEHDVRMTAVDPLPKFDVDEFKAKYGDKFEIYRELSLSRLPLLENYDVILIDGDHNWYTVYNELKIIEKSFKDKKFPLVILHDIGWPYARRDLYYNPENIPEVYRQPYKKLGMDPNQSNLTEKGGFNPSLYNSIYENNPKNGTLTAVEDFIDESKLEFSFKFINAFHGLGILFPKNDKMENIIKRTMESSDLLKDVEKERVQNIYENSKIWINVNSLKEELNENEIKLEHVENQLKSSKKSIQKKEEQLLDIKAQLNQTVNKLEQTEGKLNPLNDRVKEKEKQVDQTKSQLNQTRNNLERAENQLNLSNELIQKKEEQLKKAKNRLNQAINNLEQTNAKLKSSNSLIEETKAQLEEIEIQLKSSLELIREKESIIGKIETELEQAKNQLNVSYKIINEKENQLKQVDRKLESSNQLIEKKEKQLKKTKNQLNQAEYKLKQAEKRLKLSNNLIQENLIEREYLSNKNRSITQRIISKFPNLYILFNMNETGIKNALVNIKGYRAIKNDNLLNIGFYLKNNRSVRLSGIDPILHYMYHGFKEGKKPDPTFNGDYYLKRYKDVKNSNLNPLVHYGLYGKNEGRKTTITKNRNRTQKNKVIQLKSDYDIIINSGLFDVDWYLKRNLDVASTNMDPLVHFLRYGANENRDPSPNFSIFTYLQRNSDVAASGMNPLSHYIKYGIKEGRKAQLTVNDNIYTNKDYKPQILTETEAKEKYEKIINENASLIDLNSFEEYPLVSIIILNKDGLEHLQRLFDDFEKDIQYPAYEIIIIDNASVDGSIDFLEELSYDLPLRIIKNKENKSFSEANNQAVNIANGEFILLLNNDIKPTYGWLNQMMQTAIKYDDIGAVGAKLVYPDCSTSRYNKHNSFKIQHMGVSFKNQSDIITPYHIGRGLEPFDPFSNTEKVTAGVTAAVLLVRKETYLEVGGLDERYNFGYEDVDFCLKLLKNGYKNVYCPKALLFHYEHGTDENNEHSSRVKRHIFNETILIKKWGRWLHDHYLLDKIDNVNLISEKPLNVAFVVTETGTNVSAGDYFTAIELGNSLEKLGWKINFLSQRGSEDWYNIDDDIDVLISLLDSYDPNKIKCSNNSLIKIAWARNWFDRWISNPGFLKYDIVFASSETACDYITRKGGKESLLLPIATNQIRFSGNILPSPEYSCDYCFTGSYWDDPRDIIEMLDPVSLPYEFKLYGKNWDKFDKFKDYNQGFVDYSNIFKVYASTKIVIDDANRVTKGYGAVNSRVYDALASGALVLTNGEIGANETFKGKLPVFKSKDELNDLIQYYIENEDARLAKVKELQEFVLKNHTYENRAQTLNNVLKQFISKMRIAIKIPVPSWDEAQEWGDYHFAIALKKQFEKMGCDVILQILPEWNNNDGNCSVILVLRGLSKYEPKRQHFNVMWNISHPDKVKIDEYNQYDYVFIASKIWANEIRKSVDVPVETLLQCTDPELFYPDISNEYEHDLLFVGNSRKVLRKIIKDLLPTEKNLSVYGSNWDNIIDKKYLKGNHIPNNELRKAYSSCKILLNDHWDDMREKGFISNRLFDGFASGAFIISDDVKGAADVFGDALITYKSAGELNKLVDHYLNEEKERIEKSVIGRKSVIGQHTYQARVKRILEVINEDKIKEKSIENQLKRSQTQLKSVDTSRSKIGIGNRNAQLESNYGIISNSGFFDTEWYLKKNQDVASTDMDPLVHFLRYGANENRDPSPNFSIFTYLQRNSDVAASGMNPLLHYIKYGIKEGRKKGYVDKSKINPVVDVNLDKYSKGQVEGILNLLNKKISIIIPIYNAFDETKNCIDSVLENTKIPYELILIDDCSPDERIGNLLDEIENIPQVKVIRNHKNKGFVKSVNIGLQNSKGDVVLLNSDTKVTPKWLQKLVIAAYSNERIGTVTPLSNAAGAFSVPEIGDNEIPPSLTLEAMASLVEKVSFNINMEVPTGNGFCMFIKRETITDVGLFDEENFGKGYGEENDFCMRAIEKSWKNIIDDSTYIYHKGSSSFSSEKEELMKRNRAILDKKHPTYTKKVHKFLNSVELKKIHYNVKSELENIKFDKVNKKRILYVLHQGSGGVPNSNNDIIQHAQKNFESYVLTSTTQEVLLWKYIQNQLVKLKSWKIKSKWSAKEFYNNEFRDIYFNVLTGLRIDLVHIQHLFKHTFDLPEVAGKLGLPIILSFHDFYFICPSIHLLVGNNEYCGGDCTNEMGQCKIPTPLLDDLPPLKSFIGKWREEVLNIFNRCSAFTAPSKITKQIYIFTYPQLSEKSFNVIEHGIDLEKSNIDFEPFENEKVKILIPGNIDNHKGSEFIKQLKMEDTQDKLEFHFMGTITPDLEKVGIYHGTYERNNFSKLVRNIKPAFVGIFSICPETYCYTLSEAWTCGIPVLATNMGAVGERVEENGGGWFLNHKSPLESYNKILEIVESPEEYISVKNQVSSIYFPNTKEMAFNYEYLYCQSLYLNKYSKLSKIYKIALFTKGIRGQFPPTAHVRLLRSFCHPNLYGKIVPYIIDQDELGKINENFFDQNLFDCVLVQRDSLDDVFSKFLVQKCRENNIKLIFEIDDDLLSIDKTHPNYDEFVPSIGVIKYLIEHADLITVSTDHLKKKFDKFNVKKISNALDEKLWLINTSNTRILNKEHIKIGYIGSYTHDTDLLLIKDIIKSLKRKFAKNNIKIDFYVVGGMKDSVHEDWIETINIPSSKAEYPEFVRWLKETVNWDIAVAPLVDTEINRSKSELKYLEYTALELPCVYSDIGPYNNSIKNGYNGLLVEGNDPNKWEEQITKLIHNQDLRGQIVFNARNDLLNNYLVKDRSKIWYNVIEKLVDKNIDNSKFYKMQDLDIISNRDDLKIY